MNLPERRARILAVDDSPVTREVLDRTLTAQGYRVFTAPGVEEALGILQDTPLDLVITDFKMPKSSGLDLVRHVRENHRDTEVIMITGYASVAGAVTAVKSGAEEYLAKPFTDEELQAAVGRALEKLRLRQAGRETAPADIGARYGLIGKSPELEKVLQMVRKAASTSATVLITGESGTGKELVARAIHYTSARAAAPFVAVNCGGIPEGLLESELFGHMKGAFTGATESRAGFFQAADGGSIFLDEISETSVTMQVKLLRVLEDKQVLMVGAVKPRQVDVRILAATNKDLPNILKKGVFREDLFYRLNVINVAIPPLRDRGDDILVLGLHFAKRFAGEQGKKVPTISDQALQVLRNYYWPGNVRELQNVMQRLVVMTEGDVIDVHDLPSLLRFSALKHSGLHRTLAEVEAEHIRHVLAEVDGNKTKAAEILGIDRKTLREKLKDTTSDD
jgi:two-component system response regulator HydG